MSEKGVVVVEQENAVQAVLIADDFSGKFAPITDDLPVALLPVLNRPLVDYTLEFLSLGGVDEVFLFCCRHGDMVRRHIKAGEALGASWSLTMRVHVLVSESCHSLGDCLRDLDARGLVRGDFVLLEAGVVSNAKLLPIIKKHSAITKRDKGAAISLVFQEAGCRHSEQVLLASNAARRVLYHKRLASTGRKIDFPLEIFLENPSVNVRLDLKDTRVAICSPSVLPLFSDNFDFQTCDDFVRGLLMNEEILGSTIYWHPVGGDCFATTVTDWKTYCALSQDLRNHWAYPLLPFINGKKRATKTGAVVIGEGCSISEEAQLCRVIIGDRVTVARGSVIEDSFVFSDARIEEDVVVTHSIIGSGCILKTGSRVSLGSVLGSQVILEENKSADSALLQRTPPENALPEDKLGVKAYRRRLSESDEDYCNINRLDPHSDSLSESESEVEISDEDVLSYTQSPIQDDTKMFFNEVIDSLTRGFEDHLPCDNLILEINSSRYAYNVTVKEVNFNVIKAIFHMSLRQPIGSQYWSHLQRLLTYFSPILKNYIRNESAMVDCLQAIEDVATSDEQLGEKWVTFVLNWFYDKDHLSEDAILEWFGELDKSSAFCMLVKPFADWLKEAEEATSSDSEDS